MPDQQPVENFIGDVCSLMQLASQISGGICRVLQQAEEFSRAVKISR
jgi:hypothetical protein